MEYGSSRATWPETRRAITMDVAKVSGLTAGFLGEENALFALVGGLALHTHGLTRATLDIDWVVEVAIQDRLIARMEVLGFDTSYRSKGISNQLHPDPTLGRVDFVYDPERRYRELPDLLQILWLPGIDREEIRRYSVNSGVKERYEELHPASGNA